MQNRSSMKMMSGRLLALFATLLMLLGLVTACDTPGELQSMDLMTDARGPELVVGDPKPIFHGSTSPTLYTGMSTARQNAVVQMAMRWGGGFCTGTIISPRVVLTAAHCIYQDDGPLGAGDIAVLVGSNSASPSYTLYPSAVHYNPSWNGTERNDVAVVILSEPFNGATPIPIKRNGLSGMQGKNAQSVGFGMTHNSDYNTQRYWTTMYVSYVSYDQVTVDGGGDTGVAPGDSGGPLIYNFGNGVQVTGVASTSTEGWVDQANYASLATNEDWIQAYVDQYDDPACYAACQNVECGTYQTCNCGGCPRGEECSGNSCVAVTPGEGGVCIQMQPEEPGCSTDSDCPGDGICVRYEGGGSECGEPCGFEACSASDDAAYCFPLPTEGDGYISLCLEESPGSCSTEYESCTTSDNQSGVCLQLYEGGSKGCYAYCEPVVTCPEGTGCVQWGVVDCDSFCTDNDILCDGELFGCDCGQCGADEVCDNFACRPYGSCADLAMVGCCEGSERYACTGGRPSYMDCGSQGCGWKDRYGYVCGGIGEGPDIYPMACPEHDCDAYCTGKNCGVYANCECGRCNGGEICKNNLCETPPPDCVELCGDSVCGVMGDCLCGDCGEGEYCDNGACVEGECAPDCSGKQCGDDGCGDPCDWCESNERCIANNCIPIGQPDGDQVEPDGDGIPPDGDFDPGLCDGSCSPVDVPICLNASNICACISLEWTALDCRQICQDQGMGLQGCQVSETTGRADCICSSDIPLDGDSPDPADGDDPIDPGDNGDSGSYSRGGGSGGAGCSQTNAAPFWLLLFLLLPLGRRVRVKAVLN